MNFTIAVLIMRDIIWAIGASNSLKLHLYLIIVIFFVFGYTSNFDFKGNSELIKQFCLTDEYFNYYSSENISQIISRHENVRSEMGTKVSRSPQDTINEFITEKLGNFDINDKTCFIIIENFHPIKW